MNYKSDLVSIILPVFNAEEYLERCISSLVEQTYSNLEILIVNDGSSDNSLSIIKKWESRDPRIKVYNQKNKGLIFSLNFLINESKGQYVARMDADDYCDKNRIEKQVKKCNHGYAIVGSNCLVVDNSNAIIGCYKYEKSSYALKVDGLFRTQFCHPAVMFNLSIIDKRNLLYNDNAKYVEDLELWLKLIPDYNVCNIQENLVFITRGHDSNVSSLNLNEQINNSFDVLSQYYPGIEKEYFIRLRQRKSLLKFILSYFYVIKFIRNRVDKIFFTRKVCLISLAIIIGRYK